MTDYTPILHLPQVASNQEQKEATINTAIAILEAAMNDCLSISLAAGNVTLNTDQFTKYFLLQFTGHTVARTVTVPATPRWFAIENQGTASVVVKVAGTGLSAELPANRIGLVVSDGADVRFVVPDPISGMGLLRDLSDVSGLPTNNQLLRYDSTTNTWSPWSLAMSFNGLTDTPLSMAGNAGNLVAVNAAGTRLEYVASAANINSLIDLDDTPNSYTGAANRHLVVNTSGTAVVFATPYLRENSDFPNSYSAQGGKFLKVKATNDGVEFGMPSVADLSNGPGAPTFGDALLFLRVNAAGTALEYVPGTGGPVNFTEMLDTPSSFTGHANKLVRVGPDADRLIFGGLRLIELSDTPSDYVDAVGKVLRVNSTQSGMVFGALKVVDLADGPGVMNAQQALKYLRVNANGSALEYVKPAITEFAGVPSLTGQGGRFVRVSEDETGFEYVLNAADVAFLGLTDTPSTYANAQNKFVAVNTQGTGLIFVDTPGGGPGGGATTLDQLTDVDAPAPNAGEVLTYRAGKWSPEAPAPGSGGADRLSELLDVSFEQPALEDYVLTYKAGVWTAQPSVAAAIPSALDDLTDVDFSAGTPMNGDLLTYYNGVWVFAPSQAAAGEGLRFGEHRDWRLFFRTANGTALDIAELILREGVGLPQSAVGGTPAASDEPSGFPASAAFDEDIATYWRAPSIAADKAWLRYTFADPIEINALTLTAAAPRQLPITWDVQFSDDGGLTWITAWSETSSGWGVEPIDSAPTRAKLSFAQLSDSPGAMTAHAGKIVRVNEDGTKLEYAVFTPPISNLADLGDVNMTPAPVEGEVLTYKAGEWVAEPPASTVLPDLALDDLTDVVTDGQADGDLLGRRGGVWTPVASPADLGRHAYWRVVVDDTAAYPGVNTVVIADLSLRAAPGGPQQATGGVAIGTGGNLNGAFDGTAADAWTATLPDAWIGYHFAAPVAVQEIAVTASAVAGWATNYSPEILRVQFSDDGVTWFAGWTVSAQTAWTTAQQRVFTRPGVTTSFLDHRDTPSTYVAQANKLVQVKADESGLEFVAKPTIPSTLNDLTDVTITPAPTAGDILTFKDGVWDAERPAAVDYADLIDPPTIPERLSDLDNVSSNTDTTDDGAYLRYNDGVWVADTTGAAQYLDDLLDVELTEPSPEQGDILYYYVAPDLPGVWKSGRLMLDDLFDVNLQVPPTPGQVLTWIDTGVEGGSGWQARTPTGGGGEGGDYPLYIGDDREIGGGYGLPDYGVAPGSLYMRYEGDLYISRATPRLAPFIEKKLGYVRDTAGAVEWNFDTALTPGNWLVLFYASGANGPAVLDPAFTVVDEASGADLSVRIAYHKVTGSEAYPMPIATQSGPEDAFAVYEISGLGADWADFYQASSVAGSTSGAFAPAAYAAPGTSPHTFALAALFQKGATTPGGLNGEYFNEPVEDFIEGGLSLSAKAAWTLPPATDLTVTAELGAGDPLWAYAALYLDAANDYGTNLEPTWVRVLVEGEGVSALAELSDVDTTTTPPTDGQVLTFRDGVWVGEATPPMELSFGVHKDWRLIYYALDASFFVTTREVVMRGYAAGPQLATGGTASASTVWLTNVAANAFDGVPGTWWQSGSGGAQGAWLRYNFAAPVEVNHVSFTSNSSRTAPMSIGVQFSDDNGLTWTTAWSTTLPSLAVGGTYELAPTRAKLAFSQLGDSPGPLAPHAGKMVAVNAYGTALDYVAPVVKLDDLSDVDLTVTGVPTDHVLTYLGGTWKAAPVSIKPMLALGAHSYWRILYHTAVADYITVREAVMSQVAGGPQLATGGTPSSSSSRGSTWAAAMAFDGDAGTHWQSSFTASEGSWLRYDFAAPVEIGYVAMTVASTRTGAIYWDVQYSDDGSTWTTAYSGGTANGWSAVTTYNIGSPDRIAFTRLIDTPSSYSGQGGKIVAVREDAQGLEFLPFGGSSVPTHRGEYDVSEGYVTYDFEAAPPTLFANAYAAGWAVVDQVNDTRAKALRSPVIANNATTNFTFTVVATPTTYDLSIRYLVSSETPDLFRVYVDGVLALTDSGTSNPWKTFTTALSPGERTITVSYSKDGSLYSGTDDVRIGYIRCNGLFISAPYLSGDTVFYAGVLYLCLTAGTAEVPGTGDDWRALPGNIAELGGVSLTTPPAADQVLTFRDGVWAAHYLPVSSGGVPALAELTDVDMGSAGPLEGDVLTLVDGVWTPQTPVTGVSGNGVPTAEAPLGTLYEQRNDRGEAWVAQILPSADPATPTPYAATGARQQFTVGPSVTSLTFKLWGGAGGAGGYVGSGHAAAGGFTLATVPVQAGDLIELDVPRGGQGGSRGAYAGAGGWPDGGDGAFGDTAGGGGGGSARVWKNGVLMAVAGGGGAGTGYTADAGAGGGAAGQSSANANGGTGGTQTVGGYDGNAPVIVAKQGGYLQGGKGGDSADRFTSTTDDGGGGGGGYYGGGGGGGDGHTGGGGSGYLNFDAGVTGVTEAGDRQVPPRTTDTDYQTGIAVGYNSVATGTAPDGGAGLIVVLTPATAQSWRRLATTDDLTPLSAIDLLKITRQQDPEGDYTLQASDRRSYRKVMSASSRTVTVPPNSVEPFPIGVSVSLQRGGAGELTVLAGAGVTLEYPEDVLPKLRRLNSVASLVQTDIDVWSLFGDLEPM